MTKDTQGFTKKRANFSIDKKLEDEFTEVAFRLAVNKSALVERYIRQWVEKNRDREEA